MHYEGKIYRPWTEANSLLIQTTLGCSNNKCTFCSMFDDKRFSIRTIDDVFRDIDEARRLYPHVESIFLIDGNVLAVKTRHLLQVLNKITETFPECSKISLYAGLNDLRRKSLDDLVALKQAGLAMVYSGLESGDSRVLEQIKKGMTREQALEGMEKAKSAGIRVLLSFIFGLGGRERSDLHITATTALLNQLKPEEIAPMALAIQPGTELAAQVAKGEFRLPTPLQLLQEEQYLLSHLDFETFYWGDHGNNTVSSRGALPKHQSLFLSRVKHAIETHPAARQELLQTFSW